MLPLSITSRPRSRKASARPATRRASGPIEAPRWPAPISVGAPIRAMVLLCRVVIGGPFAGVYRCRYPGSQFRHSSSRHFGLVAAVAADVQAIQHRRVELADGIAGA